MRPGIVGLPTGVSAPHYQDPEVNLISRYIWHPESRKSGFAGLPGGISLLSVLNRVLESEEHGRARVFGGPDTFIRGVGFYGTMEEVFAPKEKYETPARAAERESLDALRARVQERIRKPAALTTVETPAKVGPLEKGWDSVEMEALLMKAVVKNKAALAAWIGRRKHGAKKMNEKAVAARKRASEQRREAEHRRIDQWLVPPKGKD